MATTKTQPLEPLVFIQHREFRGITLVCLALSGSIPNLFLVPLLRLCCTLHCKYIPYTFVFSSIILSSKVGYPDVIDIKLYTL